MQLALFLSVVKKIKYVVKIVLCSFIIFSTYLYLLSRYIRTLDQTRETT